MAGPTSCSQASRSQAPPRRCLARKAVSRPRSMEPAGSPRPASTTIRTKARTRPARVPPRQPALRARVCSGPSSPHSRTNRKRRSQPNRRLHPSLPIAPYGISAWTLKPNAHGCVPSTIHDIPQAFARTSSRTWSTRATPTTADPRPATFLSFWRAWRSSSATLLMPWTTSTHAHSRTRTEACSTWSFA